MKKIGPLTLLALSFAGCSGAPSDGNIKEALQAEQKRSEAQVEAVAANSGPGADMVRSMAAQSRVDIVSVHKIGCKDDGEKAYRCDVEIEAKQGDKSIMGQPMSLRMVKGSEGWIAQK